MEYSSIREHVEALAQRWAGERTTRQGRSDLWPSDFEALRAAGYPDVAVPVEFGGAFSSLGSSVRPICEILRTLAHGDSSVALVCSMHAAVLGHWLAFPQTADAHSAAWQAQRQAFFTAAHAGAFFGTITSEPGSGGDISLTRATARPGPDGFLLSGQKHFGSGLGITSFMLTTAIPSGETEPDWFVLDVRNANWDGSQGMKILAPWDGHGMSATQSHAISFSDFPAQRSAWPGQRKLLSTTTAAYMGCVLTSVIVGVVETAMSIARSGRANRSAPARPYEAVEWTRAQVDAWLIAQAFEGMLRAAEAPIPQEREVQQGKLAIAELAETCLGRLCRILGGGSYSKRSPIGHLLEDVRALGFLRPPWGLAYDQLIASQ